ncbi:unnamed protein product [Urochloa decumbens]|uniref:Uncharacterized protein n=1 Tax=Urochloa decumbens TaxID=240449 RepID=A0ABC9DNW6_9POAL
MFHLKTATKQDAADKTFNQQSRKPATSTRTPLHVFQSVSRLADHPGDEAWFGYNNNHYEVPRARVHPPVPIGRAFYRIKRALPSANSPTIQEVDAALSKLATAEPPLPADAHQETEHEDNEPVQRDAEVLQPLQAEHVLNIQPETPPGNISITPNQHTTHVCSSTLNTPNTWANQSGVAELFSTPDQGLLPQPPAAPGKRGRRLKKPPVEIGSLRRSKRQACSRLKHLPAAERANHVLCRRLGYIKDDITPAEQAIQEFISTFKGPMPQYIVAALTAVFHLDDDDISRASAALIKLGGPEAADDVA